MCVCVCVFALSFVNLFFFVLVGLFAQGIPFILVGTKLDLRDDQDAVKRLAERRQMPVSFSEAQGLASDLDAYRYLECSALTQHGLKQVGRAVVRETKCG